jgi:hypothetical protein
VIRLRRLLLPTVGLAAILGSSAPALASGPAVSPSPGVNAAIPGVTPAASLGNFVCTVNATNLCLTNNGTLGSLIANDLQNTVAGSNRNKQQAWIWDQLGTTTNTSPYALGSGLNTQVANGRPWGEFKNGSGTAGCLQANGTASVKLAACGGATTEWVQTGSGRLSSVGSSDQQNFLIFLVGSLKDGGNPVLENPHAACSSACWSDTLGGPVS